MNTNKPLNAANLDEYEDLAVKNSSTAKRVGVGAAVLAGGAAIAGGTAYAATHTSAPEMPLTEQDAMAGANVASAYQEEAEQAEPVETKVEHHHHHHYEQPQPEPEADIQYSQEENVYVGDEKVMTIERGTVEGHNFETVDLDGNGLANVIMVDVNDNGRYETNEMVKVTDADGIRVGGHAEHVENHHYRTANMMANNDEPQNDFQDEKTGEDYHDDLAENNPDYNPDGLVEASYEDGTSYEDGAAYNDGAVYDDGADLL